MVGRGLDREIHGQLQSVLPGHVPEVQEIVERTQLGSDRLVSAGLIADRIRTAGIVRTSHERVVWALALGVADGMNGRHVQHVEAHAGDVRDARLGLAERGAARWVGALRAREDLVPGREAGFEAIDDELQLTPVAGRV